MNSNKPSSTWLPPEVRFLVIFLAIVIGGFTLISWNPINNHVIEPFTGWIARVSGATLAAMGQGTAMDGTIIRSPRFAVNIRNGCNGVEAMIIFFAAVIAFPSSWRSRAYGLAIGLVLIQLVNLVRVVALFLTGVYFPRLFDSSHTVVWQTIVILSAVVLWLMWANRFALPRAGASTAN